MNMTKQENEKTSLEKSLQVLLNENDEIKLKIKRLLRKHAANNEQIDRMMQEVTNLELGKETFLMKLWKNLSKFLFGKVSTIRTPTSPETESPLKSEAEGQSRRAESALKAENVGQEEVNLTDSGSVNYPQGLVQDMTPSRRMKIRIIVEKEDGQIDEDLLLGSDKKNINPKDSIEEILIPNCPMVLVPSSSFGKDICLDLTGFNGASSTPVNASVSGSPVVFLFGELEMEKGTTKRKGDEEEEVEKCKAPLTQEET